jgi:diguanylate cyclase (GGDEF)-like protein
MAGLLLLGLGLGLFSRWRYLPAWLVFALGMVLIAAANTGLLYAFNRWFPPTGSLVALALASLLLFGSRILRLQNLAQRDSLTGLGNRHRFDLALRQEVKIARRSGKTLTLLLVDVDHFKRFNDTLGHHAGDLVLTRVAAAIADFVRPRDIATRFGGDEFALILPDTTREGGIRMALSLLAAVRKLPVPGISMDLPGITVSIGLHSRVPDEIGTPREIFDQADLALYQAKTEGRDRYCSLPEQH